MTDISTPAARRAAVQGVADFLRAAGELTDLEQQALAALDKDEEAAIDRGVAALGQPAAEVTVEGGTVETFVLFPGVQRHAATTEETAVTDDSVSRPKMADVIDAPHALYVDGEKKPFAVPAIRVQEFVRNANHQRLDMEQEPDGTIRIESRRYVPRSA